MKNRCLWREQQLDANDEARKVHFKGLGQLIDAAGGLDSLEDHTLATIYS